jgi:hypothetical protein
MALDPSHRVRTSANHCREKRTRSGMRPKSVSKHNSQRMRPRRKYRANSDLTRATRGRPKNHHRSLSC